MPPPEPLAELRRLEAIAIEVGQAAATIIRGQLGRAVEVGLKSSDTDVVTQTDVDAEATIRAMLTERTPGAGIMGEEGGHHDVTAELQWIVDPLDGTINFAYGLPAVAVSVAAAYRGEVVAGAVVDVVRGDVFAAVAGGGASLNGVAIRTSSCSALGQTMLATGFAYQAGRRHDHGVAIAALLGQIRDIRCFGSAALHLCWVACGRLDAYYERDIKLWDYAAGSLVAAEAGALVERPCPENDNTMFAATTGIAGPLLDAIAALTVVDSRELIRRDQHREHLRSLLLDGAGSPPGPIADAPYFDARRGTVRSGE